MASSRPNAHLFQPAATSTRSAACCVPLQLLPFPSRNPRGEATWDISSTPHSQHTLTHPAPAGTTCADWFSGPVFDYSDILTKTFLAPAPCSLCRQTASTVRTLELISSQPGDNILSGEHADPCFTAAPPRAAAHCLELGQPGCSRLSRAAARCGLGGGCGNNRCRCPC